MQTDMKVYLICPEREATDNQLRDRAEYIKTLEASGIEVHSPSNVDQSCPTGLSICRSHLDAMNECDEVHVLWDAESKGSHFDFGMAYALGKPIRLVAAYKPDGQGKSYLKVLQALSAIAGI